MKEFGILTLGGIAIATLFPYATGMSYSLREEQLYISLGSVLGIVLIIFSDRITSLKMTQNSIDIQLSNIRNELDETIQDVKQVIPAGNEKLTGAEKLLDEGKGEGDFLQEAKDIGKAMKMLREVMREYKNES